MQSAKKENKLDYEKPNLLITLLSFSDVISTSTDDEVNLESDGWT